jgi:hypothetical protein
MKSRFLFLALMLPLSLQGQAADTGAISRGSLLIGGSASVTHSKNDAPPAVLSVVVSPDLLYFVKTRLAVGGQVGLSYSTSDTFSSTGWSLGPAVQYFFAEPTATMLPFVGASFGIGRSTTSAGSGPDVTFTTTAYEGVGGIMWLLVPHVGVSGELFGRRSKFKSGGPTTSENTQTVFGLRFGISAFVF